MRVRLLLNLFSNQHCMYQVTLNKTTVGKTPYQPLTRLLKTIRMYSSFSHNKNLILRVLLILTCCYVISVLTEELVFTSKLILFVDTNSSIIKFPTVTLFSNLVLIRDNSFQANCLKVAKRIPFIVEKNVGERDVCFLQHVNTMPETIEVVVNALSHVP